MTDVLVLCYHAVSPDWPATLSVDPDSLERQLGYLARRGWRTSTLRDAVLAPSGTQVLAITFDDAFQSVRTYAFPLLDRLGMVATVFAPTAYMSGDRRLVWPGVEHWQHTRHADELTPMTWDDLRFLAERGWEIGSHTCTHPHLTQLDDAALETELTESRRTCELRLGRPCETIAYPYGDVDVRVASGARDAGYLAGARLSSGQEDLGIHCWPRIGVYHGDSWWRFRLKVARPVRQLRATRLWRVALAIAPR